MADNKTLLILRLEGHLQSWGENAKWDFRDSANMPTKSGIIGLIGCAMGLERGNADLVKLAQDITIAIRAERAGVKCVDYQAVTGNPLMSAAEKRRSSGDTIITPREYLQDACFVVFIETTDAWRERIVNALENPKWCLYLGRKNCVPSCPIYVCTTDQFATLMDAVREFPTTNRAEYPMMYECEVPNETIASILRPDEIIGENRKFGLRTVCRGTIMKEGK